MENKLTNMSKEDKKYLKNLKKMKDASDDDIKKIYYYYRMLINKPELVNEWEHCECPSIVRDMHLELVLFSYKNKEYLK